jgi:hypothetical protein
MADIFISYSRTERRATEDLAAHLTALGLTVWWDTSLISGEVYAYAIARELEDAKAVIVIWSPDSVKSEWIYSEANRARNARKLIQVSLEGLDIRSIPPPFDALHVTPLHDRASTVAAIDRLIPLQVAQTSSELGAVLASPPSSVQPEVSVAQSEQLDTKLEALGGVAPSQPILLEESGGLPERLDPQPSHAGAEGQHGETARAHASAGVSSDAATALTAIGPRSEVDPHKDTHSGQPPAPKSYTRRYIVGGGGILVAAVGTATYRFLTPPDTAPVPALLPAEPFQTASALPPTLGEPALAPTGPVVLSGHRDVVFSVSALPGLPQLVSAGGDGVVQLWDVVAAQPIRRYAAPNSLIWSVRVSPDGQKIAVGTDGGEIALFDIARDSRLRTITHGGPVYSVAFSSDSKLIASSGGPSRAQVWDWESGERRRVPFTHQKGDVLSVSFSEDGERIVSGSKDKTVQVWPARKAGLIDVHEGHTAQVHDARFFANDNKFISASSDGTVRIWSVGRKSEELLLHKGTQPAYSVDVSPDGRLAAAAFSGGKVRIWDLRQTKELAAIDAHGTLARCVAFSRSDKMLYTAGADRLIKCWRLSF